MKRLFGLALLLAGCASAPPSSVPDPVSSPEQGWAAHRLQVEALQRWQLSARLIVSNNENNAWQLDLIWQQHGDEYEIHISGPLGMGKVRLQGSETGVFLYDSDGHAYYAQEPERLLLEHTGVFMPVTSLYYWVRGLPDPSIDAALIPQLDAWGRLTQLQQNGWLVEMKRYVQVDGYQLPDKIFIHNQQDVDVRMVVNEWKLAL